ncbi:MAG TPA: MlaD family protein [Nocardioides sp.]
MRSIAVKFSLFCLVSVLLFVGLYNTMTNQVSGGTRTFTSDFTNVSGLRSGDDVRISGVKVGRVESIQVKDNHLAHVRFTVQRTQTVTDTTTLTMRYQNLLGQRYLALLPGRTEGRPMTDGDTFGLDRTDPGFDLTALLNGFEPLFDVLSPDDINLLASNIIAVLQGEGGTIESLLTQTATLTNFLADRDEIVGEVVATLTPVLEHMSDSSGKFDTAIVSMRKLLTKLGTERAEFFGHLDHISVNLESTAELVTDLRPGVRQAIRSLRRFGETVVSGQTVISGAFDALPKLVGGFLRSQSYGGFVNVYMCSLGFSLDGDNVLWVGDPDTPHSGACR